jgi:hypothetical protein
MSLDTNMSLGNTSQPGRPGPEELVPSRYALKVGDIDVPVVSDGVLPLPTAIGQLQCGTPAKPKWASTVGSRWPRHFLFPCDRLRADGPNVLRQPERATTI